MLFRSQKPPPALGFVRGDSLRRSTAAAGNAQHAFGAQVPSGDRSRRNNNYSIIGISLRRREHLYCQPFPATSTKKWMTPLTLWPSGPQSAARLKSPRKLEARGRGRAQPEWNRAEKHPRKGCFPKMGRPATRAMSLHCQMCGGDVFVASRCASCC